MNHFRFVTKMHFYLNLKLLLFREDKVKDFLIINNKMLKFKAELNDEIKIEEVLTYCKFLMIKSINKM